MPFGFSFAPAGLLFPYHLGVATYLKHIGYITDHTPLMGASAGALVTVCIALRLNPHAVWKLLYSLENQFTLRGTRGKMRRYVKRGLEEILPENSHVTLANRPQPSFIVYTAVKGPLLKPRYCAQFESKADLIKCLLASCNIPMYFTNKPFISVRQDWAVDGYFSDVRNFGCPPFQPHVNVKRQVRVMPFEASKILTTPTSPEEVGRVFPTDDLPGPPRLDYIAPDLCYYDNEIPQEEIKKFVQYINTHRALLPEDVDERRLVDPNNPHDGQDHPLYTKKPIVMDTQDSPAREEQDTGQLSDDIGEPLSRRQSIELPHVETPDGVQPAAVTVERRASTSELILKSDKPVERQPSLSQGDFDSTHLPSLKTRRSFEAALAEQLHQSAEMIERHDSTSKMAATTSNERKSLSSVTSPKKMWANLTSRLMGNTSPDGQFSLDQVTPLQPWGLLTKRVQSEPAPRPSTTTSELPFCRFSWGHLLQLALRPAHESRIVVELFELGRTDAFRWHQLVLRNGEGLEQQAERAISTTKAGQPSRETSAGGIGESQL